MIPTWLCFVLLGSVAGHEDPVDDSVVTNSEMAGTSYLRSFITDSHLTGCNVKTSGISKSVSKKSNIFYTIIGNSTVVDSILDATYLEPRLPCTSDMMTNSDHYYFNRVYDSEMDNAVLDTSHNCVHNDRHYNSTIHRSRILHSRVRRSKIMESNMTDDSASCASVIRQSDLHGADVSATVTMKLKAITCDVKNSVVENSICVNSRVANGKLTDCLVLNSTLRNSVVNGNSHAVNSTMKNSVMSSNSKIVQSLLVNSKVSNSKLSNCEIINSVVNSKTWDSVKMVNGMIVRSELNSKQLFWWG